MIYYLGSHTEFSEIKSNEEEFKMKNLLSKTELINFDLFLDSLAISSTFMKFSNKYDEIEKVKINF